MEDKIKNILVSVMFLGIITFFMSVNILTKDKDISNSERRKLKQYLNATLGSMETLGLLFLRKKNMTY